MAYLMHRSSLRERGAACPPSGKIVAAAAVVHMVLAKASISAACEPSASDRSRFRDECPGATPDDAYLEALRVSLHIVETDHPAFAPRAHAAAEVLQHGLAEAPRRQA